MGELISLNGNKNLPTNFNPAYPDGLLGEIPVQKIVETIAHSFFEKGISPSDGCDWSDLEHGLWGVFNFFEKSLKFNGWQYNILWLIDYVDETIEVEVYMDQENILTKIGFGIVHMHIENMAEFDPNSVIVNQWGGKLPSAAFVLETLEDFFNDINTSINQWNDICMNIKPIMSERPPFEHFRRIIEKGLKCFLVENHYFKFDVPDPDALTLDEIKYLLNDEVHSDFGELLFVSNEWDREFFMPFGENDEWIFFYYTYSSCDTYSTYYRFYIGRKEMNAQFKISDLETSCDFVDIYEFFEYLDKLIEGFYDSIVQWNHFINKMGGGEFERDYPNPSIINYQSNGHQNPPNIFGYLGIDGR